MKVLVTGGAGRVGRFVVQELVSRGHQVTAAGRTPDRTVDNAEYRVLDCLDYDALARTVAEHDSVIHLAGIPSLIKDKSRQTFEDNCQGTYNVYEACAAAGIKKISVASSINALGQWYGKELLPVRYFPIDEDHPSLLSDAYSFSKKILEEIGEYFWHKDGISSVSLRITWVVSPDPRRLDGMARMMNQGPDLEFFVRNYWTWIDARDSARAFVQGIEADYEGAHPLFINSDVNLLNLPSREIAKPHYGYVTDWREPIEQDEALVSCRRAKEILGWEPIYRLIPEHGWNIPGR